MILRWVTSLWGRLLTCGELCAYMGRHRPWVLPVLLGLLLLGVFVMLAQAAQISPFIYTLF